MKDRYFKELSNTKRDGVEDLLKCMEDGGFFTAPCSGQHHLAKDGGLLEHSLNVLYCTRQLNKAWGEPVDDETIIIVSLLHDLGKMGDHGKANYVENILKSGKRSPVKPFVTNGNLTYLPHEVRSVMIAERYIKLTEEEETAILWHNGLYGTFKYDIQCKETPLYMILHFADMWCSRVVEIDEVEDGEVEGDLK